MTDFHSVLIIKPSSLGDVVHTLPAVHFLKRARPEASIRWLVNTEWAPLLAGNPDLDGVIEFPRNEFRGPGGLLKLTAWMKKSERPPVDLALDFQGLARSGMLARFSGARRIHCLGDAELLPRTLAHRVVPSKRDIHAGRRYLRLVADLGVPVEGPLEFPLPAGERPVGFIPNDPFLLVHPFSRGQNKSIASADLESLCERMRPVPVIVVGRSELHPALPSNCVDLLNKTSISELIWLIRRAGFTLSVDSGPMHIAAAITGRLLGIHHWTDPRIVGPCNPEAWIWKNGALIQVKSLDTESWPAESRNFSSGDLPAVVDFLKAQMRRPDAILLK